MYFNTFLFLLQLHFLLLFSILACMYMCVRTHILSPPFLTNSARFQAHYFHPIYTTSNAAKVSFKKKPYFPALYMLKIWWWHSAKIIITELALKLGSICQINTGIIPDNNCFKGKKMEWAEGYQGFNRWYQMPKVTFEHFLLLTHTSKNIHMHTSNVQTNV